MTASRLEHAPAHAAATPPRFRFAGGLIAAEVALSTAEIVLVVAPALALGAQSLRASGESFRVAALIAALMIVGWVRLADLLRPVLAARDAKHAGRALDPSEVAVVERAMRRAPREAALGRWLIWVAAAVYVSVRLGLAGLLAWPSAIGVASIAALHAGGVAAARGSLKG